MNSIPYIIPHIFVRRVINEECILQRGTIAFQTIWTLKESVQGFDKKIRSLGNKSSIGVANYITPALVKGTTTLDLLHQTCSAKILKPLKYGFQVLLIVA